MSERLPAVREQLTPNQLDKQHQIIEAAMRVLAGQGLAACTVREVAAAGPLTKSAIHYYFADMDVLIDRAMAAHVANFEAALRKAAAASPDPPASFWNIIDAYITTFRDRPHVTRLWLEYWADASRKGRANMIAELNRRIVTLLADHLKAADLPRPAETAHGVFLILAGTILDQPSPPVDGQARKHIAALTGLRPPRHARKSAAAPEPPVRAFCAEKDLELAMVATVALGEIARMFGGGTPSRSNPNYYDGVIPWVTPKDMKSWDIYDSQIRLTKDGVDNSATKIIAADSVLVVVRSGVLKHTFPVGINRRPVAINQDIKALICEDVIVPDYLGRCLKAKSGEALGWVRATTADNIPVDKLKELRIPLPSIDEQKRIVEVLDQADALTVKRRQAASLLEDLLQSTFSEMFGSSAGDFPTVTVDDLIADRKNAIRTGPFGSQLLHGEFVSSGIPVLGIDNAVHNEFRWGQRRFITEEKFRNLARYQVFPRDVIITIMGTCGRCAVVPEGIGVAINTKHLCCISLDHSKCLPEFCMSPISAT